LEPKESDYFKVSGALFSNWKNKDSGGGKRGTKKL
jgi:hypothetical protein